MKPSVKLSKKLSWILRHGASTAGLVMRDDGYVRISDLMRTDNFRGTSFADLMTVVRSCPKQRFEVCEEEDGEFLIRATQGHSISMVKDNGLLQKIETNEYPLCIHGTYRRAVEPIRRTGLNRMKRNHIHLAAAIPGMESVISGMRRDCDTVVVVDLIGARNAGIDFYMSKNGVILSRGLEDTGVIPPAFIVGIYDKSEYVAHTHIGGVTALPSVQLPDCSSFNVSIPEATAVGIGEQPIDYSDTKVSSRDLENLYYCVIDFEATCIKDGVINKQEIIEFPAVFINAKTMSMEYEFHSYVKPLMNPEITEFCTELTGITQSMVDPAPEFNLVFQQFCDFLKNHGFSVEVDGGKSDIIGGSPSPRKDVVFVTHGNWDLKEMLPSQCKLSSIRLPKIFRRWINLKDVFQEWNMSRRKRYKGALGMDKMLKALDMELIGRHHSGIDDTRNIARMLVELTRRGAIVNVPSFRPK